MLQASDNIDENLQSLTGTTRFTWQASDGITLSAHIWETDRPNCPTVLCLAGLTRNSRDFYRLANVLQKNNLRVIAMDYRGRGMSDHAADFRTYSLEQEGDDIDRGIKALGLEKFSLIGTSRGGLHSFSMAKRHQGRISSIIINDIGPTLEQQALDDIVASVGSVMTQPSMIAAAERLQSLHGATFSKLSEADWITFANQLYSPASDCVTLCYDKGLGDAVREEDKLIPQEDLWASFNNLKPIPHLLLHGENSPLLTAQTAQKMSQLHEKMEFYTVPSEGHAPLLWDQPTQDRILTFIQRSL